MNTNQEYIECDELFPGDKVIVVGGDLDLVGLRGEVSCLKAAPSRVNIYLKNRGKVTLWVKDLAKLNLK